MSDTPLLVICGPTASGKTALAIELALAFGGEIVNADSRQVYRGMDIGTAKPSPSDRACVPHHLLDVVNPDEQFSLALYATQARAAVASIHARGKLPVLAGGTGLYVRAISQGFDIPEVAPNLELRSRLEAEVAVHGALVLAERLAAVDPVSAKRIDPKNVRRVIRALEVSEALGEPFSALQRHASPYEVLTLMLCGERPLLFSRADARLAVMVRDGFVAEVAGLLDAGYDPELPSMSALGYRELARHVQGHCTLDEALETTRHNTYAFIKRQLTWFRTDTGARRLDASAQDADATARAITAVWLTSTIGRQL